jgi:hypothetical protein
MTPKRFRVIDDEDGLSVSSQPGGDSDGRSGIASRARLHLILGTVGIVVVAVVAVVVWRWSVAGKPAPRPPGVTAISTADNPLEITVLRVRELPAPPSQAPAGVPSPGVPSPGVPSPAAPSPAVSAAPASLSPARDGQSASAATPPGASPDTSPGSPQSKSTPARRTGPARTAASSSAAKASSRPAAITTKPPEEPRVETTATKPPSAKPDTPPLETNPYVYK